MANIFRRIRLPLSLDLRKLSAPPRSGNDNFLSAAGVDLSIKVVKKVANFFRVNIKLVINFEFKLNACMHNTINEFDCH